MIWGWCCNWRSFCWCFLAWSGTGPGRHFLCTFVQKGKWSHLELQHDQFWWCEKGNWHVIMKECYDAQFSLHEQHHCQILRSIDDDWYLQLCAKRLLWMGLKKNTREALNTLVCILIWLSTTEDFLFTSCLKSHKWNILWVNHDFCQTHSFILITLRSQAENIHAIKATIHTNYLRMGDVPDEEIHRHTDEFCSYIFTVFSKPLNPYFSFPHTK